jgi:light-regulated signal transduction histidine kinase (bacteriophytochrome)
MLKGNHRLQDQATALEAVVAERTRRYRHKLFAPFQRLHRNDEFEGTGVGLVIVSRIVARHGGEVWIEGVENHGATVSFCISNAD